MAGALHHLCNLCSNIPTTGHSSDHCESLKCWYGECIKPFKLDLDSDSDSDLNSDSTSNDTGLYHDTSSTTYVVPVPYAPDITQNAPLFDVSEAGNVAWYGQPSTGRGLGAGPRELPWHSIQYSHHPNIDSLRQSAEHGCHLCTLFLDPVLDALLTVEQPNESLPPGLTIFRLHEVLQVMHRGFRKPIEFSVHSKSSLDHRQRSNNQPPAGEPLYRVRLTPPYGRPIKWKDTQGAAGPSQVYGEVFDVLEEKEHLLLVRPSSRSDATSRYWSSILFTRIEDCVTINIPGLTRPLPAAPEGLTYSMLPTVDKEPLSNKSIGIIKDWVTGCDNWHQTTSCRPPNPNLPPRILDLGTKNKPRLRLVATDRPCGLYVALSYRWGPCDNYKLTTTNFIDFQRGILEHDLPQTIRDVIRITRSICIRYIWIDALCIVQNSFDDWQVQSALFPEVYANAVLTISADRADDVDAGCLQPRNSLAISPCMLSEREGIVVLPLFTQTSPGYVLGPLLRGWIFQERFFSRRILHVGQHQLYWTCYAGTASETRPAVFDHPMRRVYDQKPDVHTDWNALGRPMLAIVGGRGDPKRELWYILNDWYILIQSFSITQFGRRTDILPAAAGLAAAFQKWIREPSRYIAGIWEIDFPAGLAWKVVRCATVGDRDLLSAATQLTRHRINPDDISAGRHKQGSEQYVAPSFSWASVDLQVLFPNRPAAYGSGSDPIPVDANARVHPLRLIEHHMSHVAGEYGQLTGCWIRVACLTIQYRDFVQLPEVQKRKGQDVVDLSFDNQQLKETPECLIIALLRVLTRPEEDGSIWQAMALIPTGLATDEYQRVGLLTVDDKKCQGIRLRGVGGHRRFTYSSKSGVDSFTDAYFAAWQESVITIV